MGTDMDLSGDLHAFISTHDLVWVGAPVDGFGLQAAPLLSELTLSCLAAIQGPRHLGSWPGLPLCVNCTSWSQERS